MPAMNMIFRIIYTIHANSTHHKLALDALRHLQSDDKTAWQALFLKHAELYLAGSKAPDKEFKDFKNHVLYVRDNYWGGAPEKAESWYRKLVRELQQGNWEQAVWSAGVLSHYYMDPIHPFHTAQCEAENNIHRAVEWSIARSYDNLRRLGLQYELPAIHLGGGETWLKEMVIAGAERANCDYETLIAGYNFEVGVVDPPAGLNSVSRNVVGRLLVYASCGFARILERAFSETGIAAPHVRLTTKTLLQEVVKIPGKWIETGMENSLEVQQLKQMYDEYCRTGKVDATLGEDERVLRDRHAQEVLPYLVAQREAQRGNRQVPSLMPHDASDLHTAPTGYHETHAKYGQATADFLPDKYGNSQIHKFQDTEELETAAEISYGYLKLTDNVEAAPSIGPQTAERLEAIGIETVGDFLISDPEELSQELGIRHVRAKTIVDWQDQSQLMLHIPRLRVTHAQLCVGAGYRSVEAIAVADAADINAAILRFVSTNEGQRILGNGRLPDLDTIQKWIDAMNEALAA